VSNARDIVRLLGCFCEVRVFFVQLFALICVVVLVCG
jgi:hypothetical protein